MKRAERINEGSISPEIDNMLKITSNGKKLALDPRCFEENAKDEQENKVNLCINEVYRIWEETTPNRSTQIIFCDLSTPKTEFEQYNPEEDFDIYNDIKSKLVAKGIPENEIRFIHEANKGLTYEVKFDENGEVVDRHSIISSTKTQSSVATLPMPNIVSDILKNWYKSRGEYSKKLDIDLTES